MFNVGGGEIIVIAFIALLVLGPQRLPDAARQAGKAMAELRRFSSGFQNELRAALDDTPDTPTEVPRRVVEAVSEVAESGDEAPADEAEPAAPTGEVTAGAPEMTPGPGEAADASDADASEAGRPSRPRRTRPLTAGDGTA